MEVIMPAFNEEAGVGQAIDAAVRAADALAGTWSMRLLVIDDGSVDDTAAVVRSRAGEDDRVRLLSHDQNRGLGAAVRTGLAASSADVVVYTDSDLPFDLGELERILDLMVGQEADVVAGYRLDRRSEGLRRVVYSSAYNSLIRWSLGLKIRDVNFAAKVLTREVVDALELHSEGSFIDAELLARADRMGFRMIQVGLAYAPRSRGSSTLSSPRVIVEMVRDLFEQRSAIRDLAPIR